MPLHRWSDRRGRQAAGALTGRPPRCGNATRKQYVRSIARLARLGRGCWRGRGRRRAGWSGLRRERRGRICEDPAWAHRRKSGWIFRQGEWIGELLLAGEWHGDAGGADVSIGLQDRDLDAVVAGSVLVAAADLDDVALAQHTDHAFKLPVQALARSSKLYAAADLANDVEGVLRAVPPVLSGTQGKRSNVLFHQDDGVAPEADDGGPLTRRANALSAEIGVVVDQIAQLRATTLPGLLVKMVALDWLSCGDPVSADIFNHPIKGPLADDDSLILSVLGDLEALAGTGAG